MLARMIVRKAFGLGMVGVAVSQATGLPPALAREGPVPATIPPLAPEQSSREAQLEQLAAELEHSGVVEALSREANRFLITPAVQRYLVANRAQVDQIEVLAYAGTPSDVLTAINAFASSPPTIPPGDEAVLAESSRQVLSSAAFGEIMGFAERAGVSSLEQLAGGLLGAEFLGPVEYAERTQNRILIAGFLTVAAGVAVAACAGTCTGPVIIAWAAGMAVIGLDQINDSPK